jgi:hypothetical protein
LKIKKLAMTELINAEYNPRKNLQENDPEYQKIKKSIDEFGYVEPIIVNENCENNKYRIIGGHQRVKVLNDLGYTDIDCVIISLDESKEKALNVALNKISGEWDNQKLYEILKDFNDDDFLLTGFDNQEFKDLEEEFKNFENNNNDSSGSGSNDNNENKYTDKIEIPEYTPKMDHAPDINELVNVDKTKELIKLIESKNIKDDKLKHFLELSANRFLTFNYENIAEFYCHQDKETQELMEDLTLIIIDLNKAISNNLVEFSEKINQLRDNYSNDSNDNEVEGPFGEDDFN